jgi:hypothetical protein
VLAGQRFCNACGAAVGDPGIASVVDRPRPAKRRARPRRTRHSPMRRAVTWIAALTVIAAVAVGADLRYTSTTCQLRRAFDVAGWTCGEF